MRTITGKNNIVLVERLDGSFNDEIQLDPNTSLITGGNAHEFNTQEELRTFIAGQDVAKFPPIPNEGEKCEYLKVYAYGVDKVKCKQEHFRMHFTPEETPALWTVIRTVNSYADVAQWKSADWINYIVDSLVYNKGAIWKAINTTHTWIEPALTGNGAISWEKVTDYTPI